MGKTLLLWIYFGLQMRSTSGTMTLCNSNTQILPSQEKVTGQVGEMVTLKFLLNPPCYLESNQTMYFYGNGSEIAKLKAGEVAHIRDRPVLKIDAESISAILKDLRKTDRQCYMLHMPGVGSSKPVPLMVTENGSSFQMSCEEYKNCKLACIPTLVPTTPATLVTENGSSFQMSCEEYKNCKLACIPTLVPTTPATLVTENGSLPFQMSCHISCTTSDATNPSDSTSFQHPIPIPVYTLIALCYILW
jgi:hypothetical protein